MKSFRSFEDIVCIFLFRILKLCLCSILCIGCWIELWYCNDCDWILGVFFIVVEFDLYFVICVNFEDGYCEVYGVFLLCEN